MTPERNEEFAEDFELNRNFVAMAYENVNQRLIDLGYEGAELEAITELTLFNTLGMKNENSDIWTVIIRNSLAKDILDHLDKLERDYDTDISYNETEDIVKEIEDEWFKRIEVIEANIKRCGCGYAPFTGFYGDWDEMGHGCQYSYCLKKFQPGDPSSEIYCNSYHCNCPGGINAENVPCSSIGGV